jgi:hypothetical protein
MKSVKKGLGIWSCDILRKKIRLNFIANAGLPISAHTPHCNAISKYGVCVALWGKFAPPEKVCATRCGRGKILGYRPQFVFSCRQLRHFREIFYSIMERQRRPAEGKVGMVRRKLFREEGKQVRGPKCSFKGRVREVLCLKPRGSTNIWA